MILKAVIVLVVDSENVDPEISKEHTKKESCDDKKDSSGESQEHKL